jgi:RAP domain
MPGVTSRTKRCSCVCVRCRLRILRLMGWTTVAMPYWKWDGLEDWQKVRPLITKTNRVWLAPFGVQGT